MHTETAVDKERNEWLWATEVWQSENVEKTEEITGKLNIIQRRKDAIVGFHSSEVDWN